MTKLSYLISRSTKILFSYGPTILVSRLQNFSKIRERSKQRDKLFKEKLKKENIDINKTPIIKKHINGNLMELDLTEGGISKDLFLDGIREPLATQTIKELLTKDDIVLEVGANIGYYALIEAKLCKKVIAVEPVSTNIERLKANIELNGYKNVEVTHLALGEENTQKDIFLSTKSNWHSFTKGPQNNNGTENVPMLTGDEFLKTKDCPTMLRMDVEGYETKILRGLENTLQNKSLKYLFIEIHPHLMEREEVKEFFEILFFNHFQVMKIIKEDKVGLAQEVDKEVVKKIINGYEGSYEIFFRRG